MNKNFFYLILVYFLSFMPTAWGTTPPFSSDTPAPERKPFFQPLADICEKITTYKKESWRYIEEETQQGEKWYLRARCFSPAPITNYLYILPASDLQKKELELKRWDKEIASRIEQLRDLKKNKAKDSQVKEAETILHEEEKDFHVAQRGYLIDRSAGLSRTAFEKRCKANSASTFLKGQNSPDYATSGVGHNKVSALVCLIPLERGPPPRLTQPIQE